MLVKRPLSIFCALNFQNKPEPRLGRTRQCTRHFSRVIWGRMSTGNLAVLGLPLQLASPSVSFESAQPALHSYEAQVQRILKLEKQKKGVILITTGSYNPVHKTHLMLTKAAIDQLNADAAFVTRNGPVLAAVMSPTHDNYVFRSTHRKSDPAEVSAMHRLQMIRLGLRDLQYHNVFVDRWEMDQVGFLDFPEVVRHYFQVWENYNTSQGSNITVMYLCGSDMHASPIPIQNGVIPLVVMTRQGNIDRCSASKYVVTVPESDGEYNASASSSDVRRAIKENDLPTLRALLPPTVLEYIWNNKLYSY